MKFITYGVAYIALYAFLRAVVGLEWWVAHPITIAVALPLYYYLGRREEKGL